MTRTLAGCSYSGVRGTGHSLAVHLGVGSHLIEKIHKMGDLIVRSNFEEGQSVQLPVNQ